MSEKGLIDNLYVSGGWVRNNRSHSKSLQQVKTSYDIAEDKIKNKNKKINDTYFCIQTGKK